MTTIHYILIAHLMVGSYCFGKDSENFNSDDKFSTKLLTFLIDIVFGSAMILLHFLYNVVMVICDSKPYKWFLRITQINFYYHYFAGHMDNIDLAKMKFAINEVKRIRSEKPSLINKHVLFVIGLVFKKAGVLYKG